MPSPPHSPGTTAFGIALGSSLNDRLGNLRLALALMLERLPAARLNAAGGLYETDPVQCPEGSMPFFNSVVEIECGALPHELHDELQRIEREMGRPPLREKNVPRTIDLDILYAGSLIVADETLVIPHPRLPFRRFVLQPLADIRPWLVLPGETKSIGELLEALEDSPDSVRLVERHWIEPSVD